MKRTPLARKGGLQRRAPMKRKRTPQRIRSGENEIPQESRRLVRVRDCDTCVRCLKFLGGTGHWHHRRTRSIRDEHRHCPCVGVLLCSSCHSEVHAQPKASRENGWIVSRYETEPATIPFRTGEIWVFPLCSGNVHLVAATDLPEAVSKRFAKATIPRSGAANYLDL